MFVSCACEDVEETKATRHDNAKKSSEHGQDERPAGRETGLRQRRRRGLVDNLDHPDRTTCNTRVLPNYTQQLPSQRYACATRRISPNQSTTPRPVTAMAAADQMDIYDSMTMQSDSETYDQPDMSSPSSPSSDSASPLILYSPPTFWGLARGAAINLLLPFVNGLMLGFGELFANELAFRFGWSNTKVRLLAGIRTETETDSGTGLPQPQTSRTRRRDANRSRREKETQRPGVERLHELGIRRWIQGGTHGIRGCMREVCMVAWRGAGVGWSFSLSCHFLVPFDNVHIRSYRKEACQSTRAVSEPHSHLSSCIGAGYSTCSLSPTDHQVT